MSIQDKVNDATNTADQQVSDLQSAVNGDPTGAANTTTNFLNDVGGLVGGKTGMDLQQAAGPAGQVAGAGVGVIEGDPSGASALFSEGYQKLGEGVGGDVGGLIQQWSPGLGEATGDGLTIGSVSSLATTPLSTVGFLALQRSEAIQRAA